MIKKNILIKTKCICGGKLKKKINFGDQPIINDFKTVKTIKYPTVITQCSRCYLVGLQNLFFFFNFPPQIHLVFIRIFFLIII